MAPTPVSTRTPMSPVLRIMAGNCNFSIAFGRLTVLCPCEEFRGTSKDGQLDTSCQRCSHPLTQHGEASSAEVATQQGSSQLETSSILDQYLSPRWETVSKLAKLIDEQKVVHVRGTPASGKTTLARLLRQHYEVNGRKSVFIDTWCELDEYPSGNNTFLHAWGKLDRMLRTKFDRNMDYLAPGTILIIDEAQRSYSDDLFWNSIIKPRLDRHLDLDISFCLFCCYGSPVSGVGRDIYVDIDISAYTPAEFNQTQRMTLTPQSHPSSPPIGLFFTRSEFTDAAQRLIANSQRFQEKFTLHPDAEEYLFSMTDGHPGGLSSVLKYIHDFYRDDIKSRDLSERVITKEHVVDSLKRDKDVWDMLAHEEPISSSLPQGKQLTPEVVNLLARVLEEGNIPCELNKEAEMCYRHGWLHRMQILGKGGHSKEVFVLPSRLHEKWIEYLILNSAK